MPELDLCTRGHVLIKDCFRYFFNHNSISSSSTWPNPDHRNRHWGGGVLLLLDLHFTEVAFPSIQPCYLSRYHSKPYTRTLKSTHVNCNIKKYITNITTAPRRRCNAICFGKIKYKKTSVDASMIFVQFQTKTLLLLTLLVHTHTHKHTMLSSADVCVCTHHKYIFVD